MIIQILVAVNTQKLKIERAREKVLKASDIGREFWSKETGTFTLLPVDSIKLELEMALNRLEAQKQVTEEVRREVKELKKERTKVFRIISYPAWMVNSWDETEKKA